MSISSNRSSLSEVGISKSFRNASRPDVKQKGRPTQSTYYRPACTRLFIYLNINNINTHWGRRTRNYSQVRDQMWCERKHVNLLLLSSKTNDNYHHTLNKNMSALICGRTKHDRVLHVCTCCVHPFVLARTFEDHFPIVRNTLTK
jgi:hypothetical protein